MNEYEQSLADFLENNPKGQKRQFMIDKRLDLCKSNSERMVVINKMMGESFEKMRLALNGKLVNNGEVLTIKGKEDE